MYTSGVVNRSSVAAAPATHRAFASPVQTSPALVSEVVYREDQPMMAQLLLLPLLQQLGQAVSLAALAHAATKTEPPVGSGFRPAIVQGHAASPDVLVQHARLDGARITYRKL